MEEHIGESFPGFAYGIMRISSRSTGAVPLGAISERSPPSTGITVGRPMYTSACIASGPGAFERRSP